MYVTSPAMLKGDIANVIEGLRRRARGNRAAYAQGYVAALNDLAVALGLTPDDECEVVPWPTAQLEAGTRRP